MTEQKVYQQIRPNSLPSYLKQLIISVVDISLINLFMG